MSDMAEQYTRRGPRFAPPLESENNGDDGDGEADTDEAGAGPARGPTSPSCIWRTFATNIFGYMYMARAARRHLGEGAAIVYRRSITGLEGSKELLDYSATKGAIHAFTKTLAQQLVARRIRVNCVAPGPIWTPLNVSDKEPRKVATQGKDTRMARPDQPEEVAPAYVFFASNADSSYITGEVLTLLGGEQRAA